MDKTFIKGLVLLEALARSNDACGVTELANALQLNKSNVHRILQALAHQGFVRKVAETGRYELTLKMWELGYRALSRFDLPRFAQPCLESLAQSSEESVHLSILDGLDVAYIAKIDGPQPVNVFSLVGTRVPAQCVAAGKVLLAWSPGEQVGLVKEGLRSYTSKSIVSGAELDATLEKVRKLGYAVNRGEWREQVHGVAAPVRDVTGQVIAAVGISGPAERMQIARMKELAPTVIEAAQKLSALLGRSARTARSTVRHS